MDPPFRARDAVSLAGCLSVTEVDCQEEQYHHCLSYCMLSVNKHNSFCVTVFSDKEEKLNLSARTRVLAGASAFW